jgi:uncharacterized protein YdgA (DUF945 family)
VELTEFRSKGLGAGMKKIIIGIVFLIVIAGVGAPFFNGLVMENIVRDSLSNVNTMYLDTGSGVSVEIINYDRNYASTEIEWKMKLGSLKAIYGVDEIIFVERATHGFTGIVSETSLEKNIWFSNLVNDKLDGKNPLKITSEYSLSGQINSTIDLDAFSLPVEDEVVEIKPGKALFTCSEDFGKFSSEVSWAGFSVAEKMQVDGISITSDLKRLSTYLWDGSLVLGIEKVEIEESSQPFNLTNLKVDYSLDVDEDENRLSVVTSIGFDNMLAGLEKVDDAFVRIGSVNMDIQGFEEFVKLYTEMANTVLKDVAAAENDPEQSKTVLQEKLIQTRFQFIAAYEKLLKQGLEFQISDLHAQLPMGEIKGDVVLSLNKDMTLAQFIPLIHQPELVLDILSLQSNLTFPAELADGNPMLLAPIFPGMTTGLFVKDGENLTHQAETIEGKLFLNGQEVRL